MKLQHLLTVAALLAGSALLPAQTTASGQDAHSSPATADDQKNNPEDVQTLQKIRRSLTQDKSLSTTAHNVKVVVRNGRVTLRGPVRSEQEKATIEAKAAEVAGPGKVVNQLTVATASKPSQDVQQPAAR